MTSQVVVPHTDLLRAETAAAVPHARYEPLDPADEAAYPRLLCALWEADRDFVLIEHDVVPAAGFAEAFDACPQPWCVFSPAGHPGLAWLGCVRFRSTLTRAFPDAMRQAMSLTDDGDTPWNWRKVDVRVERVLRGLHRSPCWHTPAATHLHDYAPPACGFAVEDRLDSPYGPRTVRRACNLREGHREPHSDERGRPI